MTRAYFVKRSRKKYPGIKKGESYWWWKFRFGPKYRSKERPRRSQLTQSPFYSTLYDIQDSMGKTPELDDIEDRLDDIKQRLEELRDECEEKRNNMPDALQDSNSGEMLQERYDALDGLINELESVEVSPEIDEDATEDMSDDEKEEYLEQLRNDKAEEIWSEIVNLVNDFSV